MRKSDKPILRQISIPTGNDDVIEWINSQTNFSRSIRMLIKMQIKMTGTEDVFEALLQNQFFSQPYPSKVRTESKNPEPEKHNISVQEQNEQLSIPPKPDTVTKTEPPIVPSSSASNSIDIKAALDSIMG